ncbi:hypothetical protein CONCODRAFT_3274 [Conidiobolus coronatus NRRL 28638]|uniref:Uncharacterized protein n=1 Tax=Conidiobolus coronatus (strain ATCC 28846 / CBS 209.66 / NRRL 28638) TaxID=796925 RepID=A0A137PFG7_CONC2|nr:hypothetical protein CONCODRAFT_3274 [Conidiobolus coronatus NRRL 28638]|eukprot:KXN73715.1 hypothetical protein CONCODRAFT_3274 [Conidiobolus coronatus NRRL 28638]
MTVCLVAVIAFTDLLAHVGEFYAASNLTLEVGTAVCTAVNGFRLFARTFYCFANIAICFHLYRSLGIGAMNGVKERRRCTPGVADTSLNVAFSAVQGSLNLLTAVIGVLTIVFCRRNLNKWINAFSSTITNSQDNLDQLIQDRRKIAIRSFLYPMSTCITLPFEAVFLLMNAAGAYGFVVAIPMAITSGLAGVLTAAAFIIDPSTQQSFKSAYYHVKYKNSDKEQEGDYGGDNNDIAL